MHRPLRRPKHRRPVAAHATIDGDDVVFRAEIMAEDGSEVRRGGFSLPLAEAADGVATLAGELLAEASPALRALFAA